MSAGLTRARARLVATTLAAGATVALAMGVEMARAEDTAASLIANPKRLAEVQQGCRTNQPWATDALCRQAAEAIRRRFRGNGVPYRPRTVDPFPTHPEMKVAPSAPATQGPPKAKPETRHRPKTDAAPKIA